MGKRRADENENSDYEVGYGKPPKSTRFKKGQSGNAKGRPKVAKGLNASLKRELETMISVREGNREVRISKAAALAKRLMEKALKGDMAAFKLLAAIDRVLSEVGDAHDASAMPEAEPEQVDHDVLQHYATMIADGLIDLGDKETDQ